MSQKPLETIEIETGPKPAASVIWMHGLGADGNDFVPIVHELDLEGAPDIRFIFPHAPMQPVSINNGYVMRAWYDVKWGDLEGKSKQADEKGVRASQAAISQLIEGAIVRGITPDKIVLAGFSQGGGQKMPSFHSSSPVSLRCSIQCTDEPQHVTTVACTKPGGTSLAAGRGTIKIGD